MLFYTHLFAQSQKKRAKRCVYLFSLNIIIFFFSFSFLLQEETEAAAADNGGGAVDDAAGEGL